MAIRWAGWKRIDTHACCGGKSWIETVYETGEVAPWDSRMSSALEGMTRPPRRALHNFGVLC